MMCYVFLQNDELAFWGARPHSEEVIHTALFNVMYLLHVGGKLYDELYQPLRDGVDIFLSTPRDAHDKLHKSRNVSLLISYDNLSHMHIYHILLTSLWLSTVKFSPVI